MTATPTVSALPPLTPARWQPSELRLTRSENGQWTYRHSIPEIHKTADSNCSVYEGNGRTPLVQATGQFVDLFV